MKTLILSSVFCLFTFAGINAQTGNLTTDQPIQSTLKTSPVVDDNEVEDLPLTCGTPPLSNKEMLKLKAQVAAIGHTKSDGITYVPIKAHFVRPNNGDSSWEPTPTEFARMMARASFELYGANMMFYTCGPVEIINRSDFHVFDISEGTSMNDLLAASNPATDALNMYFAETVLNEDGNRLGGFAYYPFNSLLSSTSILAMDNGFSWINYVTIPHELGHNFALPHTFEGTESGPSGSNAEHVTRSGPNANCDQQGDGFCDTNADPGGGYSNCVYTDGDVDIFGDPYDPPMTNLMSYYGFCADDFSPQQEAEMDAARALRATYSQANLNCTGDLVAMPTDLTAVLSGGTVDLSWTDIATNETGYLIERATPDAPTAFITLGEGGVAANATSFTDDTAESGSNYIYRLRPLNGSPVTNGYSNEACTDGNNCNGAVTCDDGIQNGDETGVDCGGSSCPACSTCPTGTSVTVTNTNDEGVGSLRAAITCANANASLDEILFDLPGNAPYNIVLQSPLPELTDDGISILMNGFLDFSFGDVVLNGQALSCCGAGLELAGEGMMVEGLKLEGFPAEGILVSGNNGTVGSDRHPVIIMECSGDGILVTGTSALIRNCYLGTDYRVFNNGNSGNGIRGISADGLSVSNCLIGINGNAGILLEGGDENSPFSASITNNLIGTTGDDDSFPNGVFGVVLRDGAQNVTIGTPNNENYIGHHPVGIDLGGVSGNNAVHNLFFCNQVPVTGGNTPAGETPIINSWNGLIVSGTATPGTTVWLSVFSGFGCGPSFSVCQGDGSLTSEPVDANGNWTITLATQPGVAEITAMTAATPTLNSSAFSTCIEQSVSCGDDLSCVASVSTTLNDGCQQLLSLDEVLTGEFGCLTADDFSIVVNDNAPSNGPIIDQSGPLTYTVTCTGPNCADAGFTECSGTLTVEIGDCSNCPSGNIILVTNTGAEGPGSLRNAIDCANASPDGGKTIRFEFIETASVYTINVGTTPLPIITAPFITIEGNGDNSPVRTIIIDGSDAGPNANGLSVEAPGVTISDLTIQNFSAAGIYIGDQQDGGIINCMLVQNRDGLELNGTETIVSDCRIGIDFSFNGRGNTRHGILVGAVNTLLLNNNFISYNGLDGIHIADATNAANAPAFIEMTGNGIGSESDFTNTGNGRYGVYAGDFAQQVFIGSSVMSPGNNIGFNGTGVFYGENTVGVEVYNASLFCNGTSIERAVAAANEAVAAPVITSYSLTNDMTLASGTAPPGSRVVVYVVNDFACPDANCQGGQYLAETTANGSGNWSISTTFLLSEDNQITALATNANSSTSLYADCRSVDGECGDFTVSADLVFSPNNVCPGEETDIVLTVSSSGVFPLTATLSGPGFPATSLTFPTPGEQRITVTPTSAGVYTLTEFEDQNGCTSNLSATGDFTFRPLVDEPQVTCGATTSSTVTINYDVDPNVQQYQVTVNGGAIITTDGGSFTAIDLPAGTDVEFFFRAVGPCNSNSTTITCRTEALEPTCDDGIQNGQETGVDCGGPDCVECPPNCDDFTVSAAIEFNQNEICEGDGTGITLNVSSNGVFPITALLSGPGFDPTVFTFSAPGPQSFGVTPQFEGTFTLSSFEDQQGCTSAISTSATISFIPEVAEPVVSCGATTSSSVSLFFTEDPAVNEYRVSVNGGTPQLITGGTFTATNLPADTDVNLLVFAEGECNTATTSLTCRTDIAPPTCDDGIQNGDETGVDCGGPDCIPCAISCDDTDFSYAITLSNNDICADDEIMVTISVTGAGNPPYSITLSEPGVAPVIVSIPAPANEIQLSRTPGASGVYRITGGADAEGCTTDAVVEVPVVVNEPLEAPVLACGDATISSVTVTWPEDPAVEAYQISVNGGTPTTVTGGNFTVGDLGSGETVDFLLTAFSGTNCPDQEVEISCTSLLDECAGIPAITAPVTTSLCPFEGTVDLSFLELEMVDVDAGVTVLWFEDAAGQVPIADLTFFAPASAPFTVYAQAVLPPCTSEIIAVDLDLEDNTAPTFAELPEQICAGGETLFLPEPLDGTPGQWVLIGTGSVDAINPAEYAGQTLELAFDPAPGICAASFNYVLDVVAGTATVFAGIETEICVDEGQYFLPEADDNGLAGFWSILEDGSLPVDYVLDIEDFVGQQLTYYFITESGCDDVFVLTFLVAEPIAVDFAPAQDTICRNAPLALAYTGADAGAGEFFWSSVPAPVTSAGNVPNPELRWSVTGEVEITLTIANGCLNTITRTIFVEACSDCEDERPVFTFCPPDREVLLDLGAGPDVDVSWPAPLAEACGVPFDFSADTIVTGLTADTTITFVATDDDGQSAECVFTIAVVRTDSMTFYVDVEGIRAMEDDIFMVPISVNNFDRGEGFQLPLSLSDLEGSGQFTGDVQAIHPLLTEGLQTALIDGQTLNLIWLTDDPGPNTFPDGTRLFEVAVQLSGENGTCAQLSFIRDLPEVTMAFRAGEEVFPTTIDGEVCLPAFADIGGIITKADDSTVEGVPVSISREIGPAEQMTDANGAYALLQQPQGDTYTITPSLDGDDLNGISVLDLVLIRNMITGFVNNSSPTTAYQYIAANVRPGTCGLEIADLITEMQLLAGVLGSFPDVPSWRFVPKAHELPSVELIRAGNDDWCDFPETITLDPLAEDVADGDFIAIKMGDINLSAGDPTPLGNRVVGFPDRIFQRGDTITFIPELAGNLVAAELRWRYDAKALLPVRPVVDFKLPVSPGDLITDDGRYLRQVWTDLTGAPRLTFIAQSSGRLTDYLSLTDTSTGADAEGNAYVLRSEVLVEPLAGDWSLSVAPNPFRDAVEVSLSSQGRGAVTLSVFDPAGRLIETRAVDMPGGILTERFSAADWPAGVYYLNVVGPVGELWERVVKQ